MAGKVHARYRVTPHELTITPVECPMGDRPSDRGPIQEPLQCMINQDPGYLMTCPYLLFVSRNTGARTRLTDPVGFLTDIAHEGQPVGRVNVMCLAQVGKDTGPGA